MTLWSGRAAINALKTTIGIIVAWGIVLRLQWPSPFLAPVAVLFLQTPYLGTSLRKGMMRIVGTLGGALAALVLLSYLSQQRWPMVAAIAALLALTVFMLKNSRYAYAWFMAAITVAVIAVPASLQPSLAFELTVYRTGEAIIGIFVVAVINGLFWPQMGGEAFDRRFGTALEHLAAYIRQLGSAIETPTETLLEPPSPALQRAPIELREILTAAALDTGSMRRLRLTYEAEIQALSRTLGALMAFAETLRLGAEGNRAFLTSGQRARLRSVLQHLADA
ncbi:MAG: FUSC family protein, partial [Thiohalocapsa sp.]